MEYAYKFIKNCRSFYRSINSESFSGAIDMIVVEQPNGSYVSTPLHVRFGKYGVLHSTDKHVDVTINGNTVDLKLKLGENGVAFLVEQTDDENLPESLTSSPIPGGSPDDAGSVLEENFRGRHIYLPQYHGPSRSVSPSMESVEMELEGIDPIVRSSKKELAFKASIFSHRMYRSLPNIPGSLVAENAKESLEDRDHHCRLRETRNRLRRINTEIDFESDYDECSSISSFNSEDIEQRSSVDKQRTMKEALSESEIDMLSTSIEHRDVTEWNWGELPRTCKQLDRNLAVDVHGAHNVVSKDEENEDKNAKFGKSESHYSWSDWFSWSRSKPTDDQGIYLDDLMQNSQSDPQQIQKYLGKPSSCSSSNFDSGNGSVGISTSSAMASVAHSADENTPLAETLRSEEKNCTERIDSQCSPQSSDLFVADGEERDRVDDLVSLQKKLPKYKRSLQIPNDKLKKLGLRKGANEARFTITTKFQGTSWCSCHIYLYMWNDRIVISDIDGTITKSDVLGHVIPTIGGQWAHTGVAELYTRIKDNGYKMIYLSSRAIGQSHYTKKYLQSIAQNSRVLPDGPLLLSPTSILMAFRREVIDRNPEEFKIAALTDLKKCFPVKDPFHVGFGNRENDVISYMAVGIPPEKILIIDKAGRVRCADMMGLNTSYTSIAIDSVDYIFPPLQRITHSSAAFDPTSQTDPSTSLFLIVRPEKFSDFTYWRVIPSEFIELSEEDTICYDEEKKSMDRKKK